MHTLSIRFNTLLLLLLVLMAGAIITMLATRAYGGPLDPTGAPASTDGVRGPGTPISSLPFTISGPGYYYVTRPLTGGAGTNGITINTSNVTLDLGGFTLAEGAIPGTTGVLIGAFRNVTVRNGAARGWGIGIDANLCGNCRVDGVQATGNGNGIYIGPGSEISDCNASLNNVGINADYGVVRNCIVSENSGTGLVINSHSVIEGIASRNNGGPGISIVGNSNTVRNSDFMHNGFTSDVGGNDINVPDGRLDNVFVDVSYCVAKNTNVSTQTSMLFQRTAAGC